MKEQIEERNELLNIFASSSLSFEEASILTDNIIEAGYRKQSEGEWYTVADNKADIVTECSACKKQFWFMKKGQLNIDRMPFCPNCGAHMRKEGEG